MNERTINDNRISKDYKYLALYWALGFEPGSDGVFAKDYGDCRIRIEPESGRAEFSKPLTCLGGAYMSLKDDKAFVILECVDRLLELGYSAGEIIVDPENEWDVYLGDIYIRCLPWGEKADGLSLPAPRIGTFVSAIYSSRLYSGFVDRRQTIVNGDGHIYDRGLFDCRKGHVVLMESKERTEGDFIIRFGEVVAYKGKGRRVVVPEGVESVSSCLFWDNQEITELILPEGLKRIGGDLCYNCANLRKANIPSTVEEMGDNPFAGCPNLELSCASKHYGWDGHLLYDGREKLVHCQIKGAPKRVEIKEGTKTIGKHAFYLCDGVEEIVIPKSVVRIQNFPFSGCSKLKLDIRTAAYHIIDGVVYTGDLRETVGCLKSTKADVLALPEGVTKIARNSFYQCEGIGKVVLPKTLTAIGYNPFNGCPNIEFESRSESFKVIDGRLYNADASKLICCPKSRAVGEVRLPDSVIELERSAFSGCSDMTGIVLKNVGKIGKSCFSGCSSLKKVYVPDHVAYVGEWAFSHCKNLEEVSVGPDTFVDRNCFSGSPCKETRRQGRSNYLIESENLFFLKGCKDSLQGKVDSIVIDPPYNSKIDYVGYQDDFGGSYLSFLKDRFETAKALLKPAGWMVVCIDRGGLKAVKEAASSIFGRESISVRLWKKLDRRFDRNKEKRPGKKKVLFEYIVFCRNSRESSLLPVLSPKGKTTKVPFVFSGYGTTSSAKDEIAEVFGNRSAFSTPKPIALIRELIRATCPKGGIAMDFFAGSGTLGVATMELNAKDGGDRAYILVTNGESSFAERIADPRLKAAESKFGGSHRFIR